MPRKTKTKFGHMFSLGDVLPIEPTSIRNLRFTITEIRNRSGGSNQPTVDYVDSVHQIRLRLMPTVNSKSKVTHRAVVLSLYEWFPYNEGMLRIVRDDSKLLKIEDIADPKKITHEDFWRIGEIGDSAVNRLSILSSKGFSHAEIEAWDYSRLIDVNGVETEEFVFVEMNLQDGIFEIWRGCEMDLSKFAVE